MAKTRFFDLLSGYEKPSGVDHSGKRFFALKYSGTVTQKTKRFLSSRPIAVMKAILDRFTYTAAKTYGAFFLSFGLLSLILNFVKGYFEVLGGEVSFSALVIGAVFSVIAIPLLLVDEPISKMLQSFKPTDVIFFEFFCIKRLYVSGGERSFPPFVAVFFGILLALVGAFIPLWWIAVTLGALVYILLSFISPEFSFFSSIIMLPYISLVPYSSAVFGVAVLVGVLSFIRKAFFGKRVIYFEQYDLFISVMMLAVLTSGIFLKGFESFYSAVILSVMMLGYFLAGNIVTNRRLADCTINAVAISSVPCAIVSLVTFILNAVDGKALLFLDEGINSTLSTPRAAAVFFIVATVFSFTLCKESHGVKRGLYALLSFMNVTALILSGRLLAILAMLLGVSAYFLLKAKRGQMIFLILLLALPYLILLVPVSILDLLPPSLFKTEWIEVARESLSAFLDNLFIGIGIGEESFVSEMKEYGISGAIDSGNLFLELGLEAGIFALAAFVILIAIRLGHRAVYRRYTDHSEVSKLSPLASVALFSLLVFGSFESVFSDITSFYIFFAVFGLGSASLRVARREYDDRVLYFEHEKSNSSSMLNINLR